MYPSKPILHARPTLPGDDSRVPSEISSNREYSPNPLCRGPLGHSTSGTRDEVERNLNPHLSSTFSRHAVSNGETQAIDVKSAIPQPASVPATWRSVPEIHRCLLIKSVHFSVGSDQNRSCRLRSRRRQSGAFLPCQLIGLFRQQSKSARMSQYPTMGWIVLGLKAVELIFKELPSPMRVTTTTHDRQSAGRSSICENRINNLACLCPSVGIHLCKERTFSDTCRAGIQVRPLHTRQRCRVCRQ